MKKYLLIFVGLILAILAYFSFGHYATGAMAGTLVKLSKKGVLFGTYEGKLNTQMYIDESSSSAGVGIKLWDFSVINSDSLIAKMEEAMLNGNRVKLEYRERYFSLPWLGDTRYIVYNMEQMKKQK